MFIQVAGFLEHSTVNGEGFRSVLFVSGCPHRCPHCQNQAMQDFEYGEAISIEEAFNRIHKNKPLIDGVTFSGGEPFEQCEALIALSKKLKADGLTIWSYSGYTYEQLKNDSIKASLLKQIDVLVDGTFIETLADSNLKYRGSSNQHIYALEDGEITDCLDSKFDS